MRTCRLLLAVILLVPLLLQASAASPAQTSPQVTLKMTRCVDILSVDGKDNYDAYCAVCHGQDGKGQGRAALALKGPLPDLTTLAKSSGGFNFLVVQYGITGQYRRPPAHGTVDMPTWQPVFTSTDRYPEISKLRIYNLTKYIESMQQQ